MVSLHRGFSTIILIIVLFNSAMVQSSEEASQSLSNVFWSSIKVIVGDRSILDVPSGVLLSQHLTGILGPSGSGKSTFLNALSGRLLSNSKIPLIKRNILDVQADVACCDASFSEIGPLDKSGVAFVHQDDSFFGMLTVKETIGLASQLKHHNGSVDGLISLLGLMHVRDSRVGDIDRRGISGGERKRLAVACEMLGSPRLLLADEPTSGLDSFRAQQVVALLKSIAETHGIAAVASIHQPRSSIWSMLDDVLLLTAGGRVAYLGPRQDVVAFFRRLGYACPAATNPAEYLIDLVSMDTSSTTAAKKSHMRIAHIVDAFAMHTAYTANHSSVPNITSSATADAVSGTVVPGTGPEASSSTVKVFNPLKWLIHAHQAMTRSCVRLTLLLRRALKQSLRDHTTNLARLGVSIVLATVIGTVYSRDATSIAVNDAPYARVNEDDVGNRVNVIAQACINVGMLAVIKTLQIFKKERPVVSREFSQNQYSAAEYVISKTAAELPLDALIAGVFASLLHWRAGLAGQRSDFVGLLALQGCVCSTLGLAVGAVCPEGDVALAVGPSLMVVYIILGAVGPSGTARFDGAFGWLLRPLRNISPFRWATETLCISEFSGFTVDRGGSSGEGTSIWRRIGMAWRPLKVVGNMIRRIATHSTTPGTIDVKTTASSAALAVPRSFNPVLSGLRIEHTPDMPLRQGWLAMAGLCVLHTAISVVGLMLSRPK